MLHQFVQLILSEEDFAQAGKDITVLTLAVVGFATLIRSNAVS